MSKLDELCQLHEQIRVIYVVDGYLAQLFTAEGDRLAVQAYGESVTEAISNLETILTERGVTLKDVRQGEC